MKKDTEDKRERPEPKTGKPDKEDRREKSEPMKKGGRFPKK